MSDSDAVSMITTGTEKRKITREEAFDRADIFEAFVNNCANENPFVLPGIHFYTFTQHKIKFGFNPSEICRVSRKIKFIIILKYTGKYWIVGRNTIPVNYKEEIFGIFLGKRRITDRKILWAIDEIYSFLMEWSAQHEEFRRRKIVKYRSGEIEFFDLDSEDEELYLSQEERDALKQKRETILMRMIPPKRPKKRVKRRRPQNRESFRLSPTLYLD